MKIFNRLMFYTVSMMHQSFYFVINRLKNKTINLNSNSAYSISLTSYGKRISTVYLTLESLARQSVAPISITLWVSKQDINPEDLPKTLKRLEKRGVDIKFVDENIRSYKKLYYEYKEKKDEIGFILTADDDVFYPNWLGKRALEQATKENDAVVCFRSHIVQLSENGSLLPYTQWKMCKGTSTRKNNIFPTGVGSVLYPIGSLKGLDLQKQAFLECAPHADDVWFKVLALTNGYTSTNVGHKLEHFYCVLSEQRKGLELINIGEGRNDVQLRATMNYFGVDSSIFDNGE
ncbi:hypothetical protein KW475_21260 [Vibrio fluvialis]|nr:hypothetical protein [Vibrio fluvialis]